MKIVFLHTDFRVYWVPRLTELYLFLKKQQHSLFVVEVAGKGSPYSFSSVCGNMSDWHILFPDHDIKSISSRVAQKAILAKLDEISPDIVFAGAIAYVSGMSAIKWCRKHHVPVVIFDNARESDVPRSKFVNFIKREIYANVDAVLIPAPSHIPFYNFLGVPRTKMYLGLNVVDNSYWHHLSVQHDKRNEVVKNYKLPEHFILGVGRQISKKNWLLLLQAYVDSHCQCPLVLVGNGPDRAEIESFIEKNLLASQIILIDFQPPEILAILYSMADVTVLPSLYGETWGLTINEAMACGSPVLVSDQCGCCETLCKDGVTGFSFSPDLKGIVTALEKWQSLSESDKEKMGENAEKLIAEWGVEKFSQSVLKASEDLTKENIRGYRSLLSRIFISFWKGRYRPV